MDRWAGLPSNIFERGVEPAGLILLLAMSVHLDKHGNLKATFETLGNMCKRTKGWVSKNMKLLIEEGLVEQVGNTFKIVNDVSYGEQLYNNTNLVNNINNNNIYTKTTLPENYKPSDQTLEKLRPHIRDSSHLNIELEKFCNHAIQNNRKLANWDAAFRNWILIGNQKGWSKDGSGKKQASIEDNIEQLDESLQYAEKILSST